MAAALRTSLCRTLSDRRTSRPVVQQQRGVVRAQQLENQGKVAQQNGAAAVVEQTEERIPSASVHVIQPISRYAARAGMSPHAEIACSSQQQAQH
jgi:hypothetical protein